MLSSSCLQCDKGEVGKMEHQDKDDPVLDTRWIHQQSLERNQVHIKISHIYWRGLIKNKTQTAGINTINLRIFIKHDVSYASQHTFSKVTVNILTNLLYKSDKGSGTKIKKTILTVNL